VAAFSHLQFTASQ